MGASAARGGCEGGSAGLGRVGARPLPWLALTWLALTWLALNALFPDGLVGSGLGSRVVVVVRRGRRGGLARSDLGWVAQIGG